MTTINRSQEKSPMCVLRFKEKRGRQILQQAWQVTETINQVIVKVYIEWRDVPSVKGDEPDVEESR